jgi:hypothetical protein
MKHVLKLLILLLIFSLLALSILFIRYRQNLTQHTQTNVPNLSYKAHILGGFSIDTPERAMKAARGGIQVVFNYGQPPSESD